MKSASYHDLHITTSSIPRTSIFNLPYNLMIMCTRTGGWELWDCTGGLDKAVCIAGEYSHPEHWLVLDVNGHVIVDSRRVNGQEKLSEVREQSNSSDQR